MATWPGTLPQDFLVDGYQESPPDNLIRQTMEVGPPKVRRRQTSAPRIVQAAQILNATELGYLETFVVTTTSYGADQFDMPHPRSGSTVYARFFKMPTYTALSPGIWRVGYQFEILP
jgi:hypothetical protein